MLLFKFLLSAVVSIKEEIECADKLNKEKKKPESSITTTVINLTAVDK